MGMQERVTPITRKDGVLTAASGGSNIFNMVVDPDEGDQAVVVDTSRGVAGVVKVFTIQDTPFCRTEALANAPAPWAKQRLG